MRSPQPHHKPPITRTSSIQRNSHDKTPALRVYPSVFPLWLFTFFLVYAVASSILLSFPYLDADNGAWLPLLFYSQASHLVFLAVAIITLHSLSSQKRPHALPIEGWQCAAIGLYAVGWVAWGLPLNSSTMLALFATGTLLLLWTPAQASLSPAPNTSPSPAPNTSPSPAPNTSPSPAPNTSPSPASNPSSGVSALSVRWVAPWAVVLAAWGGFSVLAPSLWDMLRWAYLLFLLLIFPFVFSRYLPLKGGSHSLSVSRLFGMGVLFSALFFPAYFASDALQSLRVFSYVRDTQGTPALAKARILFLRDLHRWPRSLHRSQSKTFHGLQQLHPTLDGDASATLIRILSAQSSTPQSLESSRILMASLPRFADSASDPMLALCKRDPKRTIRAQRRLVGLFLTPRPFVKPSLAQEAPRYAPMTATQIALLVLFHTCLPPHQRPDLSILWTLFLDPSRSSDVVQAAQKALSLQTPPSPREAYEQISLYLPKRPKPALLAYLFAAIARAAVPPDRALSARLAPLLRDALQRDHTALQHAALLVLRDQCLFAPAFFAPLRSLLLSSEDPLRLAALRALQRSGDAQCNASTKHPLHPAFTEALVMSSPQLLHTLFVRARQDASSEVQKEARRFLYRLSAEDLRGLLPQMLASLADGSKREAAWWVIPLLLRFPSLPKEALSPLLRMLQHTPHPLFQQAVLDAIECVDADPSVLLRSIPPAPSEAESAQRWASFKQRLQQRPSFTAWLLSQSPPTTAHTAQPLDSAFLKQILSARRPAPSASLPTSHPPPSPSSATQPTSHPASLRGSATQPTSRPSPKPMQTHLAFEQALAALLEKEGVLAHYKARITLWELFSPKGWPPVQIAIHALPALYPPLLTLDHRRKHTHLFLLRLIGRLGPHAAPALPVLRRLLARPHTPKQSYLRFALADFFPTLQKEASPLRGLISSHYRQTTDISARIADILIMARLGETKRALRLLRRECSVASPIDRILTWRTLLQEVAPQDTFVLPLVLEAVRWLDPIVRRDALSILDLLRNPKARSAAIQQAISASPDHRDDLLLLQQRYTKPH
ncbi:hypothetical protein L6R29_13140 [Myxococcota bacterium]|nr:hypothetical protein [Myxococcota bacterium]